jgi:predicted ribosomally synthesized peptide with nif11-like leader
MSQEAAAAFVERMRTDEALCARVMAVEDVAERLQLINAEGFDCSAEEIMAVSAELREKELSGLVGGGFLERCMEPGRWGNLTVGL